MKGQNNQRLSLFMLLFRLGLILAMVVVAYFAGRGAMQPDIARLDAAMNRSQDELAVIKQDYNALLKGELLKTLVRSPIEQGMKADEWEQRQRLQKYLLEEEIFVPSTK